MPYPTTDYVSQYAGLGSQVQNVGIAADATANWVKLQRELKDFKGIKERYKGEILANVKDERKRNMVSMQIDSIKDKKEFMEKVYAYETAKQEFADNGITAPVSFGFEPKEYERQKQEYLNRMGTKQAQGFTKGVFPQGEGAQTKPYSQYLTEFSQLSPEAQKQVPSQFGQEVSRQTQVQEKQTATEAKAAEEASLTKLQEMEVSGGVGGAAETQQEAYKRLATGGVAKPTPTMISYIGTMPKTQQERQAQTVDIEKKQNDLRKSGTGSSDDIVKANNIYVRTKGLETANKRLMTTLQKAVQLAESNDTEKLMKMMNEGVLQEAGYTGSIEPSDLQQAYESAVADMSNLTQQTKKAQETIKILEKKGESPLARAGSQAASYVESEAKQNLAKDIDRLKTGLSPSIYDKTDLFFSEASKLVSPETIAYLKDQINGGKRVSEILRAGVAVSGGGGQYPNATSAIKEMFQSQFNRAPTEQEIQKQISAWQSQGVELD